MKILIQLINMKKTTILKPKPDLKKPIAIDTKFFNDILKRVIGVSPSRKKNNLTFYIFPLFDMVYLVCKSDKKDGHSVPEEIVVKSPEMVSEGIKDLELEVFNEQIWSAIKEIYNGK